MEIEIKYAVPGKEISDSIWEDACMSAQCDPATMEKLVMKAIYFDTEDGTLAANNVAVRVRAEGERTFATMKWGGTGSENGLKECEEVNIPVSGEQNFMALPAEIFKESDGGEPLLKLIGDKPLVNLLETRFLRSRLKMMYGASVIELALDNGSIVTDAGEAPICELELELYAGSVEDLRSLGDKLAKQYDLKPENRSKFARGIALLKS